MRKMLTILHCMLASVLLSPIFTSAQTVVHEGSVARQAENTPPANNWVLYTRAGTPANAGEFISGLGTPPSGCGSFKMTTNTGTEKVQLFNYEHVGLKLADITEISYWTYRQNGDAQQVAALNLVVDFNGPDVGGFTTLVFEPVYNTDQGAVVNGVWQEWDAYNGGNGKWWSTRAIPGVCAFDCFIAWSDIVAANPNATILGGVGLNQGSGNPNLVTAVDKFTFHSVTYNFESSHDTDGDGKGDACDNDDDGDLRDDWYDCAPLDPKNDKVLVCHKGETICIEWNAWINAHSKHGDKLGPCGSLTLKKTKSSFERLDRGILAKKSPPPQNPTPSETLYGDALYVPQGNPCNSVQLTSDNNPAWAAIDFPIPSGLTIGQLNMLSTDYMPLAGGIGGGSPRFVVETATGHLFFNVGDWPSTTNANNLNTWYNSGNLTTGAVDASHYGGSVNDAFNTFQSAHSSDVITYIYLVVDAGWMFGNNHSVLIDNSNINGQIFNYQDDCDKDGILDSYDCDPQDPNNKKVFVCHKGQTICVDWNGWINGHLKHGDKLGACTLLKTNNSITDRIGEDFKLGTSPNPFRSTTKLEYSIPVDSRVSIRIYDILGREVSTVVNADRKAGTYTENYDGSKLTTGVYYARMIATADGKQTIQTQKLVRAD